MGLVAWEQIATNRIDRKKGSMQRAVDRNGCSFS
jgi:hypothetical protein